MTQREQFRLDNESPKYHQNIIEETGLDIDSLLFSEDESESPSS